MGVRAAAACTPQPRMARGACCTGLGAHGCARLPTAARACVRPRRQKFIEAELAKRLGTSSEPASAAETAEARRKRMEAELYQVPAELQVCALRWAPRCLRTHACAPGHAAWRQHAHAAGTWLTGWRWRALRLQSGLTDVVIPGLNMVLTEVATSASVRMQNIEETEAMKRRMLGG